VNNEEELCHVGNTYDLIYSEFKAHPPKFGAIPPAEM